MTERYAKIKVVDAFGQMVEAKKNLRKLPIGNETSE
jgi:hypothetical protein